MSQKSVKSENAKSEKTEEDTDIVMTHGAADDDEDEKPEQKKVETVSASTLDAKGSSNAAKLNSTLKKMEQIKARKQFALQNPPLTSKNSKKNGISKPEKKIVEKSSKTELL